MDGFFGTDNQYNAPRVIQIPRQRPTTPLRAPCFDRGQPAYAKRALSTLPPERPEERLAGRKAQSGS